MPLPKDVLEGLQTAQTRLGGGFLRNPLSLPLQTCGVCSTPTDGFALWYQCNEQRSAGRLADQVGVITYAMAGSQSGFVMRGYKAQPPVEEHRLLVSVLAFVGVGLHTECAARLLGHPVTHWSTVPSLPARAGEHPLRTLVAPAAYGTEVQLRAASEVSASRSVNGLHFEADRLPAGSHVLLVDDTWTGGGHAQSANLALRTAGAEHVSVLVIGRWLNPQYGVNEKFIREHLGGDFDPSACPWTRGDCPT